MTDTQKDLVLHLLRRADWSQAVAYYREETGADPEMARAVIDEVAAAHGIRRRRPWLAITVGAAAALAACGWLVRVTG